MSAALFLLVLSAIGVLLWAGICALVVVPQKIRARNWNMEYDPRFTILRFVVTGILGQVLFWFLGLSVLGSVAYSKYCAANANARIAYRAAVAYQEEHPGEVMHTAVWYTKGVYPEDSFEFWVLYNYDGFYDPSGGDCYYAVTFNEAGKPEYGYWSMRPLDAANLHAHSREEARKIVQNPFADDGKLTGGWSINNETLQQTQKAGKTR